MLGLFLNSLYINYSWPVPEPYWYYPREHRPRRPIVEVRLIPLWHDSTMAAQVKTRTQRMVCSYFMYLSNDRIVVLASGDLVDDLYAWTRGVIWSCKLGIIASNQQGVWTANLPLRLASGECMFLLWRMASEATPLRMTWQDRRQAATGAANRFMLGHYRSQWYRPDCAAYKSQCDKHISASVEGGRPSALFARCSICVCRGVFVTVVDCCRNWNSLVAAPLVDTCRRPL
jgi:hypothetical protein